MYSSSKFNVFECWWEDVNEYAWLETQFFDRADNRFYPLTEVSLHNLTDSKCQELAHTEVTDSLSDTRVYKTGMGKCCHFSL